MMMLCEPSLIIMLLFIKHIKSSHSAGNILGGECGHVLMFVSSKARRVVSNSFFGSQQWIANKYILEIIRKQYYSTLLSIVKITRMKQYKCRKKSGLNFVIIVNML